MTTIGPAFHLHIPPDKSKDFDSKPWQIYALRKAFGLTRAEFGAILGLYINPKEGSCTTMIKWELGQTRPMKHFRQKMLKMVATAGNSYKEMLETIKREPPRYAKLRLSVSGGLIKTAKRQIFISPEQLKELNADSGTSDNCEAVFQGIERSGEAN